MVHYMRDDTLKSAVEADVFTTCVRWLDPATDVVDDDRIPQLTAYALQQIENMSRYMSRSTSPMSNLIDDFRLQAWSRVYFYLHSGTPI